MTKQRRARGEGSIRRRADGRWEARLTLPDGRRKSFMGPDQRTVQQRLRAALTDVQNGEQPGDERLTFGQFARQWIEAVQPTVGKRTAAHYADTATRHLIPTLGAIRLRQMQPTDVERLLNAKSKEKKADGNLRDPRSVAHMRAVLRRMLNSALRQGIVRRNVATLVDPPAIPRKRVHAMSPDEAQRILAAVNGDRLGPLVVTALGTGARQGELFGLRWQDVDFEARTMTIRQTVIRVRGKWDGTFGQPKTAGSERSLPLPAFVVAALKEQQFYQQQDRLLADDRWQDYGLVFATSVGTPLDGGRVLRQFHRALEAAGLKQIRFHDLRHGCASLLLARGTHPRVVMEQLGHSTIALTMNTYSHVIPALQREAADTMDGLFQRAEGVG